MPALDEFEWIKDFNACLGIELLLQHVVERHADAVDEDIVRLGYELRATLQGCLGVLRVVVDLKPVQRAVKSGSFVFIPDYLLGLRVLIVAVIGGVPTEHRSVEELLGVIWIVEVFETTVAHCAKAILSRI